MQTIYQNLLRQINVLSAKFSNMPMDALFRAYDRAMDNNPWIQNKRVKQINTLPVEYSKDAIGEAIKNPGGNEALLRGTHHALEATAYPMLKIRKLYTDLMTYNYYTAPAFTDEDDAKTPEFWREAALLEKFNDKLDPKANAHKATGQAIQEGKVFYYIRYDVDKSHNKVNYAFMQKLPPDWLKIIGYNNISGYTVSFDMFYFLQPGTDWRQFGDLFIPYLESFDAVIEPPGNAVFASKGWRVNLDKLAQMKDLVGNPEAYVQNGRWAYWVTLPIDKVWGFEIDDTNPNLASTMTGLYLSMSAIAQYEQVQLELVQNPLIVVMTGEIPYRNDSAAPQDDGIKLSEGGRILYETLWYNMLSQNNTSGIGFFMAPAENLKLHQLAEAPSATEISTNGYGYAVEKSGLAGLIPINDNPRAGTVNISIQLEAKYCQRVYQQFERMMNYIYSTLNLRYTWRFHMFGDLYNDEKERANMQKSMSMGVLPDLYRYNAIMGRSLLDDLSMSAAVKESGVLDMRLPLVTSYTAKNGGQLPPSPAADQGGRPEMDIADVTSEGTEDMKDAD